MFKRIVLVWTAVMLSVSACEYSYPYFDVWREGWPIPLLPKVHFVQINNSLVQSSTETVIAKKYLIGGAGLEVVNGVYKFHKFNKNNLSGFPALSGGAIFKHETEEYYLMAWPQELQRPEGHPELEAYLVLCDYIPADEIPPKFDNGVYYYGKIRHVEHQSPEHAPIYQINLSETHLSPGILPSPGILEQDDEDLSISIPSEPYYAPGQISQPITVYVDFSEFVKVDARWHPDYAALQYRQTSDDEWITIKEIDNPNWITPISYKVPLFGENITIPQLDVTSPTQIQIRIYLARGFYDVISYAELPVNLTISTNRRPTW